MITVAYNRRIPYPRIGVDESAEYQLFHLLSMSFLFVTQKLVMRGSFSLFIFLAAGSTVPCWDPSPL